jgi:hypothetical protein
MHYRVMGWLWREQEREEVEGNKQREAEHVGKSTGVVSSGTCMMRTDMAGLWRSHVAGFMR